MFGPEVSVRFAVELLELAQFFRERHLREKSIDALFDVCGSLCEEKGTENKQQYCCDTV
jgi:hypothetical protein